jgi:hypothetical protein
MKRTSGRSPIGDRSARSTRSSICRAPAASRGRRSRPGSRSTGPPRSSEAAALHSSSLARGAGAITLPELDLLWAAFSSAARAVASAGPASRTLSGRRWRSVYKNKRYRAASRAPARGSDAWDSPIEMGQPFSTAVSRLRQGAGVFWFDESGEDGHGGRQRLARRSGFGAGRCVNRRAWVIASASTRPRRPRFGNVWSETFPTPSTIVRAIRGAESGSVWAM